MTMGLLAIAVLFIGFGAWAFGTRIAGAVVAPGQIEVEQQRQVVQHPDGGVVQDILVREGATVRPGDVLEIAEKAKNHLRVKAALAAAESRGFPEWVQVDTKEAKGVYKARPERSELSSTINESLVVELYSK